MSKINSKIIIENLKDSLVYQNSWTLSIQKSKLNQCHHYYLCECSSKFTYLTDISENTAPDIVCPHCENDYFKDADEFRLMKQTKIWKDFQYSAILQESSNEWIVAFEYDIPLYDASKNDIITKTERLMQIALQKDGYGAYQITYYATIMKKYSLFKDERVQALNKLLLADAKEKLYDFIINKKYKNDLSIICFSENKLELLRERLMLDTLIDQHRGKSIKKALYRSYENARSKLNFYPYADFIFSHTITNVDLLKQLIEIDPLQKKSIFPHDTYSFGIDFLHFLQQHYSQKQLTRFFIDDLKSINQRHKWRDTLQMLLTEDATRTWQNHFLKVKLSPKRLHDEIIRAFHIVSYKLKNKEKFEYQKKYLSACSTFEGLTFQLPQTVAEFSLWSQLLHNCMFGYAQKIHQQNSVIYGVFQNEDLLYAIELRNTYIVQAKASFNHSIPDKHRTIIEKWREENLNLIDPSKK